jgi:hypothetical protein
MAYNISPLTIDNYATWSIKVEMLLIHFALWSVVDSNEMDPGTIDGVVHLAWKSKDSKAHANIFSNVKKSNN